MLKDGGVGISGPTLSPIYFLLKDTQAYSPSYIHLSISSSYQNFIYNSET